MVQMYPVTNITTVPNKQMRETHWLWKSSSKRSIPNRWLWQPHKTKCLMLTLDKCQYMTRWVPQDMNFNVNNDWIWFSRTSMTQQCSQQSQTTNCFNMLQIGQRCIPQYNFIYLFGCHVYNGDTEWVCVVSGIKEEKSPSPWSSIWILMCYCHFYGGSLTWIQISYSRSTTEQV